ncbi:hypothetical protein Bhyg_11873 [Pseudolycoriella hygida]|uniref:Uncharacterized protein n=1 Tax=Pseudolycoriella hygida TaxID=35572 RepID=A0A9Q0S0N1_9DIPT|nr:hypothetical protein Bhyg_11873 [Pseudolycoriella hygida]
MDGSLTGGLHNHMKLIHKENTLKKSAESNIAPSNAKISSFFHNREVESLDDVLSRMAALDGIPFQLFCSSDDIRKGLTSRGFTDIPKSPNTIRKYILNYAEKIRDETKARFDKLISEGQKFSCTSDEWTSLRNRRFINLHHLPKR